MSNRVTCQFCTKEKSGHCSSKNANVELTKRRVCSKFVLSPEKLSSFESRRKPLPVFKPTYRYYDKLDGKEVDKGPLFVRVK